MSRHIDEHEDDALRRDDPLRRALRSGPQPPVDDVDWMALHARIRRAAEPALAARSDAGRDAVLPMLPGAARSVWQPLAGWSPFGIPLAAAATVVLMIGAALIGTEPVQHAEPIAFRTIEEEFVSGLGGSAGPLIAGIGTDDMLDAVLFYDGEDWQP